MSNTLQSVATQSSAALEYLRTGAFDTQDMRIGIRKDGSLALYKGMQYLLHPNETHRALKFLKENKFSESARSTLQQDSLRLSKAATRDLIMTLRTHCTSYAAPPLQARKSSTAHRPRSASAPTLATPKPTTPIARSRASSVDTSPMPNKVDWGLLPEILAELARGPDNAPPLPPKMNREALCSSVEAARRAAGVTVPVAAPRRSPGSMPVAIAATAGRPTPMPRNASLPNVATAASAPPDVTTAASKPPVPTPRPNIARSAIDTSKLYCASRTCMAFMATRSVGSIRLTSSAMCARSASNLADRSAAARIKRDSSESPVSGCPVMTDAEASVREAAGGAMGCISDEGEVAAMGAIDMGGSLDERAEGRRSEGGRWRGAPRQNFWMMPAAVSRHVLTDADCALCTKVYSPSTA